MSIYVKDFGFFRRLEYVPLIYWEEKKRFSFSIFQLVTLFFSLHALFLNILCTLQFWCLIHFFLLTSVPFSNSLPQPNSLTVFCLFAWDKKKNCWISKEFFFHSSFVFNLCVLKSNERKPDHTIKNKYPWVWKTQIKFKQIQLGIDDWNCMWQIQCCVFGPNSTFN